jgi:hypothetical protein
VAAGWRTPKLASTQRSSSCRAAAPALTKEAWASVLVASPSGYSSAKSSSTRTTPSLAGEGRARFPDRRRYGSGNGEDVDLGWPDDSGLRKTCLELRVAGEIGCLLGRGEVVGDEDVVSVVRMLPHPGAGAAVLAAEPFETVVDGPSGGVVVGLVANHKCCGISCSFSHPTRAPSCPDAAPACAGASADGTAQGSDLCAWHGLRAAKRKSPHCHLGRQGLLG